MSRKLTRMTRKLTRMPRKLTRMSRKSTREPLSSTRKPLRRKRKAPGRTGASSGHRANVTLYCTRHCDRSIAVVCSPDGGPGRDVRYLFADSVSKRGGAMPSDRDRAGAADRVQVRDGDRGRGPDSGRDLRL